MSITFTTANLTRIPHLRKAGLILLLCLAALASPSTGRGAERTLVFAIPDLTHVVNDTGDGYLDKVFDEMFARVGRSYRFEVAPGTRALVGANNGTFDGNAARIGRFVENFPNLITVPEPVISVVFAAITRGNEAEIRRLEDVGDRTVGYVRGWLLAEKLFAEHQNIEVVPDAEIVMKMLAEDRIDVAFLVVAPALHIADNIGLDDLVVTELRFEHDMFIYLNKTHAELAPLLAKALKSMKADGTYGRLMTGYYPEAR